MQRRLWGARRPGSRFSAAARIWLVRRYAGQSPWFLVLPFHFPCTLLLLPTGLWGQRSNDEEAVRTSVATLPTKKKERKKERRKERKKQRKKERKGKGRKEGRKEIRKERKKEEKGS